MKITRRQLRKIIKESLDIQGSPEEYNAMIGYLEVYLDSKPLKGDKGKANMSHKFSTVQTAMFKARDGDESMLKNLKGKDKAYYAKIKEHMFGNQEEDPPIIGIKDERPDDYDDYVQIGSGTKKVS